MASYSSFKKIDSTALVDGTVQSAVIAADTIPTAAILNANVPAAAMDGTVTSAKIANSFDISAKTVTYRPILNADVSISAGITGAKLATGAAVANLGYTPVNRTGDTMTGALLMPAGSAASPSLARSGDSNTGIRLETDNFGLTTGGTERQTFNSANSAYRRPNHPQFLAAGTGGWLYSSNYGGTGFRENNSTYGWDVPYQTGGSNFNTSTGRWTAPVTGYYFFAQSWYFLNDNNSVPSYIHAFIHRNSSISWNAGGRAPYTINMHGNRNNYDDGANYSAVMQLNAGDYAGSGLVWHSTNSRTHAGHETFSGYLIG